MKAWYQRGFHAINALRVPRQAYFALQGVVVISLVSQNNDGTVSQFDIHVTFLHYLFSLSRRALNCAPRSFYRTQPADYRAVARAFRSLTVTWPIAFGRPFAKKKPTDGQCPGNQLCRRLAGSFAGLGTSK